MADPKWFAGRLRELREAAGLTQGELAERAGLTRVGVAQLEIGRRKPAWETVLVLCDALGVECGAFTQAPADRPAPGPGRPRKAEAGDVPVKAAGVGKGTRSGRKPPGGPGQKSRQPRGRV
jgi:transcriptional regulator with XRE-family HTH domain